jgi:hypothetical protein
MAGPDQKLVASAGASLWLDCFVGQQRSVCSLREKACAQFGNVTGIGFWRCDQKQRDPQQKGVLQHVGERAFNPLLPEMEPASDGWIIAGHWKSFSRVLP